MEVYQYMTRLDNKLLSQGGNNGTSFDSNSMIFQVTKSEEDQDMFDGGAEFVSYCFIFPVQVLLGRSDVSGWGAFLKNGVAKHEYLGEYTGELISHREADKRGKIYDREGQDLDEGQNEGQQGDQILDVGQQRDLDECTRNESIPLVVLSKIHTVISDFKMGRVTDPAMVQFFIQILKEFHLPAEENGPYGARFKRVKQLHGISQQIGGSIVNLPFPTDDSFRLTLCTGLQKAFEDGDDVCRKASILRVLARGVQEDKLKIISWPNFGASLESYFQAAHREPVHLQDCLFPLFLVLTYCRELRTEVPVACKEFCDRCREFSMISDIRRRPKERHANVSYTRKVKEIAESFRKGK